jgi:hypothetical protein
MAEDQGTAPLIYLDVDDEITSAAARIRAAEADTVTLVLPYGSRLATSRINFRLLAREAAERGKQIEIVTADASARSLAAAAGLTVHPSVAAYEGARAGVATPTTEEPGAVDDGASEPMDHGAEAGSDEASATGLWSASGAAGGDGPGVAGVPVGGLEVDDDAPTRVLTLPRRKSPAVPLVGPPRPPIRTGLAAGIGLAVVLLVAVGGLLAMELLPSATIVLAPRAEPIRPLNLAAEARTDVTSVDDANLLIPAQRLEFDLATTYTVTATGLKVVETKATGNVTFSNLDTGGGVFIPAGTVLRTKGRDKVEFATLSDVTLPAATYVFEPDPPRLELVPSTGSVGIEAVDPGEAGNVGNNTITEVTGGGRNLQVTNPEATSGGERTESPEISQDDVDAAIADIAAALAADLDAQIAAGTGVPPGMTTYADSKVIGVPEYSVDPATLVGSTELEVDVLASAGGTILGVDASPVETIARSRLEAETAEGWSLDPDSVAFTLGTPALVGDTVTFPFTIAGTQVHDVDQAALIESIRGLILPEARTKLEAYGDAQVTLWPDWVTTIPDNADRITLTLAEPAPAPSPTP